MPEKGWGRRIKLNIQFNLILEISNNFTVDVKQQLSLILDSLAQRHSKRTLSDDQTHYTSKLARQMNLQIYYKQLALTAIFIFAKFNKGLHPLRIKIYRNKGL